MTMRAAPAAPAAVAAAATTMAGPAGAERWTCVPCKRRFVTNEARAMHLYRSSRHPSCKPCKRGFVDQESKRQHIHAVHLLSNTYCTTCDRAFMSEQALLQHRRDAAVHNFVSDSDSDADAELHFHPAVVDHINRSLAWEPSLPYRGWVWTTTEDDDNDSATAGDDSSYFNPISDDQESDDILSDNGGHPSTHSDSNTDTDSDAGDAGTGMDTDTDTDTDTSTEDDSDASSPPRTGSPRSSIRLAAPSFTNESVAASLSSSYTLTTEPNPDSRPTSPGIVLPKARRTGSGYTCPLCLDQDVDSTLELSSIKCGHVFCTPCITRALDKKRQCPVCRSPAKARHLRRIFLTF